MAKFRLNNLAYRIYSSIKSSSLMALGSADRAAQRYRIVVVMKRLGRPTSVEELAIIMNLPVNTVGPRITELQYLGLVVFLDRQVKTRRSYADSIMLVPGMEEAIRKDVFPEHRKRHLKLLAKKEEVAKTCDCKVVTQEVFDSLEDWHSVVGVWWEGEQRKGA